MVNFPGELDSSSTAIVTAKCCTCFSITLIQRKEKGKHFVLNWARMSITFPRPCPIIYEFNNVQSKAYYASLCMQFLNKAGILKVAKPCIVSSTTISIKMKNCWIFPPPSCLELKIIVTFEVRHNLLMLSFHTQSAYVTPHARNSYWHMQ